MHLEAYSEETSFNGDNTLRYPVLIILFAGHASHAFVNGRLAGTAYGSLDFAKLTFS